MKIKSVYEPQAIKIRCTRREPLLPIRVIVGIMLALCGVITSATAQQSNVPAVGEKVTIDLAESADLNLDALVRLVADRLKMRIIYDDGILTERTRRIIVRGSASVSTANLLVMLQATLRVRGLALVDAEFDDFKRIVPLDNARNYVPQGTASDVSDANYVTEIFQPEHIAVSVAEAYIRAFSAQGTSSQNAVSAHITTIPDANLLIVTDLASSMKRIESIVSSIDVRATTVTHKFLAVQNLEAVDLKNRLDEIIQAGGLFGNSVRAVSGVQPQGQADAFGRLQVWADQRTNRLLLVGSQWQIDELEKLINQLDVPLDLKLIIYRFDYVSPDRVDTLLRQTLGEENVDRVYQSVKDEQANQLIVTTRADIHQKLAEIKTQLDVAPRASDTNGTVRFYRLKNVNVRDILDSLQAIERSVQSQKDPASGQLGRLSYREGFAPPGPNRYDPNRLEGSVPVPPVLKEPAESLARETSSYGLETDEQPASILPGRARLTVEEKTNTLIVVAEPAVQALYAEMIEKLDRLLPQVLVEARVVTIAGDDALDLGVEISGGDRTGLSRLFAFTSYGLSTADPATGALSLIPGLGFNGTLVDPASADAIVRALATHQSARITSTPRVLVNDNATGVLTSVSEVPFLSVNASQTVATTSFAGFAEAGTTIRVTPHVSEGDHLRLEFDIVVNDFTGAASETSPPPRQTDQVTSEVTIPDGHTVIVGGLKRHRAASESRGIPLINRIPVVKYLFGEENKRWETESLFIFIKPVILRDDKFRDLRYLSECPRQQAGICGDYPQSVPLFIR